MTCVKSPVPTVQFDSYAQMGTYYEWLQYIPACLVLHSILNLIGYCLRSRRQLQELKQALDIKNSPRTPQDILKEYKNNPGHKFLPRSERKFREHQLEKHLKQTWTQRRSHTSTKRREPVRENPAVKELSCMSRQLWQPSPPKSRISHLLHVLFLRLCIYTALPFLTCCVFCHNLGINLTESYLLQVEEESDDVVLWELDPV